MSEISEFRATALQVREFITLYKSAGFLTNGLVTDANNLLFIIESAFPWFVEQYSATFAEVAKTSSLVSWEALFEHIQYELEEEAEGRLQAIMLDPIPKTDLTKVDTSGWKDW